MRLLMTISWLLALAAASPAFSQALEDPRLDPAIEEWLRASGRVPVLVELDGGLAEAREAWRHISRALDSRYGQIEGPPNIRREFLVSVNRFGLVVLLSFDQVQSIHLPFEMTFP